MSCSLLKANRRFGGTRSLYLQGQRASQALLATHFHAGFLLGLFFDLKGTCSSETSGDFQRATPLCIPQDSPLH
jgi:hypothetical protein